MSIIFRAHLNYSKTAYETIMEAHSNEEADDILSRVTKRLKEGRLENCPCSEYPPTGLIVYEQ